MDLRISPDERLWEAGNRNPVDITARLVAGPGYEAWPGAKAPDKCRWGVAPHPLVSANGRGKRFGRFVVQGEFRTRKQIKAAARGHGPKAIVVSLRCDCGMYEVRPLKYLLGHMGHRNDDEHLCCIRCRLLIRTRRRYADEQVMAAATARSRKRYEEFSRAAQLKRAEAVTALAPGVPGC